MSTWKGKSHTYQLEVYNKHGYPDWGDVEFKWEYQTTADYLSIITTQSDKEPQVEYYGQDWAIAHMETMLDWFATYHSVEQLEAIVAAIKESKK